MTLDKITILTGLSVLIIMLGMPNIEQGLQEARSSQALLLAQQIKTGVLPPDTVDPWGQKFDIHHTSSNVTIVTSFGSNKSSPTGGYDSDDISTSMSNPPHIRTMTRKRLQVLATLALSVSPWLVSFALLIRGRIARQQLRNSLNTTQSE